LKSLILHLLCESAKGAVSLGVTSFPSTSIKAGR